MTQAADYALISPDERKTLLGILYERFGMDPALFDRYHLFRAGRRFVMIASFSPDALPVDTAASLGIPFMRVNLPYPKLTTAAAMAFGSHATSNVVDVSIGEARAFVRRETIRLDEARGMRCTGKGYVLVRRGGHTIGLGYVNPTRNQDLKSLYPGRWSPSG